MASIIGQTFWKSFGKRRYLGTVKSLSPKEDPSDPMEEDYYVVLYEDGDSEELTLDEVKDALAAQFNPNDDVSIEYDGEWFDGKVLKWVDSGLRVIFDVDKSSTVIKLSEIRHRLKLISPTSGEKRKGNFEDGADVAADTTTPAAKKLTKSFKASTVSGTAKKRHSNATSSSSSSLAKGKAKKSTSDRQQDGRVDKDENISAASSKGMAMAEAKARALRETIAGTRPATAEEVTDILLAMGDNWPTQSRPNVADKAVQGMCLGLVYAFTNGLRTSLASCKCPEVTKIVTEYVKATLPEPDFKFSSIQINYNYAARRHVDGNNMGPSYIQSFGQHTGGNLWTANLGILDCHHKWRKFNGKVS